MAPTSESRQSLYSLYWYDPEQTINVLEVHRRWTWDEAFEIIQSQNEMICTVSHPAYSIVWLQKDANLVPHGGRVLYHLRKLVEMDPGKEEICIFLGDVFVVQSLVNAVATILPQLRVTSRYRFAANLGAALKTIATHKQAQDMR